MRAEQTFADRGLIPAHAGKTRSRSARLRRRGGSSPLTRGKHRLNAWSSIYAGLIPAHAGKTHGTNGRRRAQGAHPRSRGENAIPTRTVSRRKGSSPLTRGKQRPPVCRVARVGLIPAHAGKTPWGGGRGWPGGAHPRSRGENSNCALWATRTTGSSPLTRGKHSLGLRIIPTWRLIPAHAGKTEPGDRRRGNRRAHPRSRGENQLLATFSSHSGGSSPLTRGKHEEPQARPARQGLIPAHAGKTGWPGRPGRWKRAHPRSRGENTSMTPRSVAPMGSSPLTRGKLARG